MPSRLVATFLAAPKSYFLLWRWVSGIKKIHFVSAWAITQLKTLGERRYYKEPERVAENPPTEVLPRLMEYIEPNQGGRKASQSALTPAPANTNAYAGQGWQRTSRIAVFTNTTLRHLVGGSA